MVALLKHKPSFRAELRMARIAPRKMRWVVDVIRGKDYNSALAILRAMPQKGAMLGIKLLKSAFANASQKIREQRLDIDPENLHLVEAHVNGGMIFWGLRPSSMRRPQWIHRRTSHITFVLQERETSQEASTKRTRKEAGKKKGDKPKEVKPEAGKKESDKGSKKTERKAKGEKKKTQRKKKAKTQRKTKRSKKKKEK